MLPTPEISDWSSNARLMPVRLARVRATNAASSKSGSTGSRAMCRMGCGSSAPPGECLPGGLGRLLLGLLLAPALAVAEILTGHPDGGGEVLLVVRALLAHHILRDAQAVRRGELLQAGLPVQAGTALRRVGHH